MNKPHKIIWTSYLFVWIFLFVTQKSDFFAYGESILVEYLLFGWIPFLIAHFIWKDKKRISNDNKHS